MKLIIEREWNSTTRTMKRRIPLLKWEQKCLFDEAERGQTLFKYKAELSCVWTKNRGKASDISRSSHPAAQKGFLEAGQPWSTGPPSE